MRNSMEKWGQAYQEFYTIVGRCIAEWGNVEDWLFRICRGCLGPYEQSSIVYCRTPRLDARVELVDELVKSIFLRARNKSKSHDHVHTHLKTWNVLKKDMKGLLSVRRRIAHHPITEVTNYLAYFSRYGDLSSPQFHVAASKHERMRGKSSDDKPLVLSDLKKHLKDIEYVKLRLEQFFEILIAQHEEFLPPSAEG